MKPPAGPPVKINAMDLFRAQDKAAKAHLTADGYDNFISRVGLNNENTLSAGTYEFNLVTRNRILLEAAYRGSWIVGMVIDAVAEDMTRAGIDITTNEADEDIKDLQAYITKLKIWESIASLVKWGRLYGGAIGVLQIKGQSLATPLDLDTIGEGQFEGIVVFDRWMLNPSLSEVIDSGPDMGLPKYYQIVNSQNPSGMAPASGMQNVHFSRVIRYTGIDLPFFQAITEMMWGESILERLWDRLIAFDNATMSAGSLIDRANLRTIGVEGLREAIGAGGEAQAGIVAQFEMMRAFQTNEGMTLIDKEDVFSSTAYSFAGLSDMVLQFGQQLAGASGIPLIRLFGQSPAGLSATGEGDIRMYYDNINAQQKSKLLNPFTVLLQVLWRSKYGSEPPKDLEFTFTPLWQMSALDQATVAKSNTETVLAVHEAGVTDRETTLKELRQSSGDTGLFTNITDEQIKEAEGEEPPMPDAAPAAETPAEGEKQPVKNLDAKPGLSAWQKIKVWLG